MASIVSKLARAAFPTRASPSTLGAVAARGRPAAAVPVSPAGGPKSEEEEKAKPKSEVAPDAAIIPHPKSYLNKDENPYRHLIKKGCKRLYIDEKILESKESLWAFYEYWCKFYGKSRDRPEMTRRFRTFCATARRVHKINTSGPNVKLTLNAFADMTQREIYPRPKWTSRP